MATTRQWLLKDEKHLASVLPRATDIVASHGVGSWLIDVDGNRYLDFTSGIAVTNTGHAHPQVVQAIQEQAARLIHTSVVTHQTVNIELAERLAEIVPYIPEAQSFFCNSGAECVDGALKLARYITGKPGVITFSRAFHGRTLAATSLTSAKRKYREGYGSLLPGVYIAPYGTNLGAIDWAVELHSDIGAMIVEPVLGEGGYEIPPVEWLRGLREKCHQYGIMLILDEVQTGVGRTGNWFAAETFGITPDVLLSAKALGSGMPIGAIIAPRTIMDKWETGKHGSTFGGNPISCASALATIDIIEPLLERVRTKGQEVVERLSPFNASGIGYMIRLPFDTKPACDVFRLNCLDDGLLLLSCGPGDNITRLMPPLTVTDDEWEIALTVMEKNLAKTEQQ